MELSANHTYEQIAALDPELATELLDKQLLTAALHDPLSNYPVEQDHFLKYAPQSEVRAWKEWNRAMKETLLTPYASCKEKTLRRYGEVPHYIEAILEAQDPLFWKTRSKRNAFFKRNPLFCIGEYV